MRLTLALTLILILALPLPRTLALTERAVVEVGYEGDEAQQVLLRLAWGRGRV